MRYYYVLLAMLICGVVVGCGDDSSTSGPGQANQAPTISDITANHDSVEFCGNLQLNCQADDPDGDNLDYQWIAEAGKITGSGNTINWKAPYASGNFEITCSVNDGRGGVDTDTTLIAVVLPEGLVAFFPFIGNANDESGNSNHGSPSGVVLEEDRFGIEEAAYYFDGASSFISIDNYNNMSPDSAVSITAWLKLNSIVPSRMVIYDRLETHDGYGMVLVDNGYPMMSINGGAARCTSYVNIADEDWHYVACTYDMERGEIKIYVDGNPSGTTYYSELIDYDPEPRNQIGRTRSGENYLSGVLDELSVFDFDLTESAIQNYNDD